MSQRLVPWRSKQPATYPQLSEAALQLKLFLVAESGPTSFTFKDEDGNKFKLSIGTEIECSCNPQLRDHCEHTLFVLLKKFRVDKTNPIAWQASYVDSEIVDILAGKYQEKKKDDQPRRSFLHAHSRIQENKKKENKQSSPRNQDQSNRLPIDNESICPICQEDLKEDQMITYCRKKCGNNFHIKCIRIWIDHKMQQNDKITCPMCRTDLGSKVNEEIRRDEDEFYLKNFTHKIKCFCCHKKVIVGNIYHCIICKNINLCHQCFEAMQHKEHNCFLFKHKKDDEWKIAQERGQQQFKMPSDAIHYIKDSNIQKQEFQAYNFKLNDYKLAGQQKQQYELYQSNEDINQGGKQIMYQFLLSCIPLALDVLIQKTNELSVVGMEVNKNKNMCICCNRIDTVGNIKKLFCKHCVDSTCLLQLFQSNIFYCPIDGLEILPGYCSAYNLNKNQSNKNNIDSNISLKQISNSSETPEILNQQQEEIKANPFDKQENEYVYDDYDDKQSSSMNNNASKTQILNKENIRKKQSKNQLQNNRLPQIHKSKAYPQQVNQFQQNNNQQFGLCDLQIGNSENKLVLAEKGNKFRIKKSTRPPVQKNYMPQQFQTPDLNIIGGGFELQGRSTKTSTYRTQSLQKKSSIKNNDNNIYDSLL